MSITTNIHTDSNSTASSATSAAPSASPSPAQSCTPPFPPSSTPYEYQTNAVSNNLISTSITSLGLTDSETRSFLSSPNNYLSKLPSHEAEHVRSLIIPAYRKGFRIIFIIGAALSAFAFVLAVVLMPQVTLKRADDEKLKEEGKERVQKEKSKSAGDEERR